MLVKNAQFKISAVSPKQYPTDNLPEIVLVGKSNVGKSSFINTMVNRKKLARTSSEPGKTRQINFYNIDEKFYFVDLPGYGYSKMSNIALIIFLIDIRHEPSANDKLMYNYIVNNSNLPCIIIANKADKIAVTKVDAQVENLQKILNPLKDIKFLPFSSERKIYIEDVWNSIATFVDID